MKSNIWKPILLIGSLALAGLTMSAGPLQRADVPAEPTWLVHFDFDGLRSTPIGQFLQTEMEKPEPQAKLAAFQAVFSFDLRTQLHGATLFGSSPLPQDGVLMLYADFDADRLVVLAKAAKDSRSTNHNQHVIYNWIDEKRAAMQGGQPRVYAAIQGNRIVFGQREAGVAGALDVLDGLTPNVAAGNTFAPLGIAGDTSFLEGAVRKMDLPTADPNAAIFRLSRLTQLQVGGTAQQMNATLTLQAGDADTAQQMASIVQGLVALLKLQKDKPEAIQLANSLTVKQDGVTVTTTLSLPSNDVLNILKAGAARAAAQKAEQEPIDPGAK